MTNYIDIENTKKELEKKYNVYKNECVGKIDIINKVLVLLPSLEGAKVTKRLEKKFMEVLEGYRVTYYKEDKSIIITIPYTYSESRYDRIPYNDYVEIKLGDTVQSGDIVERLTNWKKCFEKNIVSVDNTLDNLDVMIEKYDSIQKEISLFKKEYDVNICNDLRLKFY